jgi:hypothetical protein
LRDPRAVRRMRGKEEEEPRESRETAVANG